MYIRLFIIFSIITCYACNKDEQPIDPAKFTVSGCIEDSFGTAIIGAKINYDDEKFVLSNQQGRWHIDDLDQEKTLTPSSDNYSFYPSKLTVNSKNDNIKFTGTRIPTKTEKQVLKWLNKQQLPNGLLESAENGNFVSLYDNALAAMVFMFRNDFAKAEKVFDFFDARINTELKSGVGGFSQFRDANGTPGGHRWMGDNAWLLIALNNYKSLTGNTTYDNLANELSNWLISLQDTDGGLFAGYGANNLLLNYKVTEGNIDAFNAIDGYTEFHSNLLEFLKNDRWDANEKVLVSWPSNPKYLYALDLHPWSYSMFKDFPITALTTANWFLNTQIAVNGTEITGFCFDEDNDAVWLEGTGQMALAYGIAGMQTEKEFYLNEMEKILIESTLTTNAVGFPYVSNMGTAYGADKLWDGANTNIVISSGAWYLFAKYNFNPFVVGRDNDIPAEDMFWTK